MKTVKNKSSMRTASIGAVRKASITTVRKASITTVRKDDVICELRRKASITTVRNASITTVRKDDVIGELRRKASITTVRKDDVIGELTHDDMLVEKDGMIGELRHDDMLVEVLIKLPVKKLFQFMCVSKLWRSMILQPWFRVYYLKHNPCGLLIRVDDYCPSSFWYSTLREAETEHVVYPEDFFNTLTIDDPIVPLCLPVLTQTINGLFCVIDYDLPQIRVFLFSVWRGKIMELPGADTRTFPDYHFGFEPVDGVYKLLDIHRVKGLPRGLAACEILTLNSSNRDILSWKKLPDCNVPLDPPQDRESICVNGFLFWLYPQSLISFDLKEEKFRSLHPPHDNSYHFTSSWITQFKGRLALFKWDSDVDELVLYTLDDKVGLAWTKHVTFLPSELQRKVRSDIFEDDQGYIWTKYVTYLPKELRRRLMDFFLPIVVPVGNLPTGELLLANATSEDPFTTVYSYNHKNNSFQRLVVGKLPQSVVFRQRAFIGHVAEVICCVEPNFSPTEFF